MVFLYNFVFRFPNVLPESVVYEDVIDFTVAVSTVLVKRRFGDLYWFAEGVICQEFM